MPDFPDKSRLKDVLALVLEVAEGNYSARIRPSDAGDNIDAIAVGLNLVAESLELERQRRKRAEALLRDEVHAYEQAPAMFCSIDMDGLAIVKCNETLAKALELSKDSLLRRRILGFIAVNERGAAAQALEAISANRHPQETRFHLETQGGKRIPVLLSGTRASETGKRLRLVLRDTSRERSLEAQLRQAQKLEAVGRLASGVAHDFNNILAVVLGSSALLQRTLPEGHDAMREVSAIMTAAENGTGLTKQLLTLSKPIPRNPINLASLNQCILDAEPLLLRALGPSNKLLLALGPAECHLNIDPSALVQVLLNLTVNARDAMPGGGSLSIQVSCSPGNNGEVTAKIVVSDNGIGMDADVLEQVLEPFYTTKGSSGGSGLGLSVSARVVHEWRGLLDLDSRTGEGTSVTVALPCVMSAPQNAESPAEPVDSAPHRAEEKRILVVDDDPLVRHVLVCTLEAEGYMVLSADGLEMALEAARAVDVLDVLVSDVVMPGASGPEVANELWNTRPGLPVVFLSGYTGDRVSPELLKLEHVRFLGKPFHPDKLVALIAELAYQSDHGTEE